MENSNKTTFPIDDYEFQDFDDQIDQKYGENITNLYQNHLLCYAHDENMKPNQVKEYIQEIVSKIQGESYLGDDTMKLFAKFLQSPQAEEFYLSKDENKFRLVFADNNHNDKWPILILQGLLEIFQTMKVDVPKFCEQSILDPDKLDERCSKENDSNLNQKFEKYPEIENNQMKKGLNQQFKEAETTKFIESIEKMFNDGKEFENQIKILRILSGNFDMAFNIKRELKKKEKFDFIIFCGSKHSQGISHLLKGKSALIQKHFSDFDSSSVESKIFGYVENRGINTLFVENQAVGSAPVIQNQFNGYLKDVCKGVFDLFPKSQFTENFVENLDQGKFLSFSNGKQNQLKPTMTKDDRQQLEQTIFEIFNSFDLLPAGYNWHSYSLFMYSQKLLDQQYQILFKGYLSIKKTKPMTNLYFFELQITEREQREKTNIYEFQFFYPKKNWQVTINKEFPSDKYDKLLRIHGNYF